MLHYRPIDIKRDKKNLLELQCQINYACESPYYQKRYPTYKKYRKKWMATTQTKEFLSRLRKSIKNERTIAKIVEVSRKDTVDNKLGLQRYIVGYFWVQVFDIIGYDQSYAEISELAIFPEYQRKGFASEMIKYIEKEVQKQNIKVIRSGTGILNVASQKLHKKLGFEPVRFYYEKIIK